MENNKIETLEKSFSILREELTELREIVRSGFAKVNGNFEKVNANFEKVNANFEMLNKKIDDLSSGTDHGFGEVETKLDSLSDEIKKIADVTRYDELFKNLNIIKGATEN